MGLPVVGAGSACWNTGVLPSAAVWGLHGQPDWPTPCAQLPVVAPLHHPGVVHHDVDLAAEGGQRPYAKHEQRRSRLESTEHRDSEHCHACENCRSSSDDPSSETGRGELWLVA